MRMTVGKRDRRASTGKCQAQQQAADKHRRWTQGNIFDKLTRQLAIYIFSKPQN